MDYFNGNRHNLWSMLGHLIDKGELDIGLTPMATSLLCLDACWAAFFKSIIKCLPQSSVLVTAMSYANSIHSIVV